MEQSKQANHWQLLISTLAVVGVTAWAYVLAFLFEYGYLFHFGIPAGFVQIRHVNIIVAMLAVGGTTFTLLFYGFLGLQPFIKGKPFTRVKAMWMSCICVFLLFVGIPFMAMQFYIAKITLPILTVFAAIGMLRLWFTEGKTWEEKLKNMEEKSSYLDKPFLFLEEFFGFRAVLAGALILSSFCISFFVGGTWATIKQTFPILKHNDQEYVVVRIYDESVVSMPFIRATKMLVRAVSVFDMREISSTGNDFTIEKIDRLQTVKQ